MKKLLTLRLFFSLVLFFSLNLVASQTKKNKDSVTSTQKVERYGIRFGVDLYKVALSGFDKNYKGFELVGDFRLTKKYYLAAELGNENKTSTEDLLNFTSKGSFIKAGFDFNAHENWLNLENMIYLGMRYGVSTFDQELNSYKVYNANPYFGQSQTIISGEKFTGLTAQWVEVILGVKTRVFNSVFVGFSLRANFLVSNNKPNGFDNLYIPGFNKTYAGNFGAGFNYTVSYLLPIYKKKQKATDLKVKSNNN